MAKQKRVEEPGNIQLNPVASPVNTFVNPAGNAPVAPTPMPGPAPPPSGPNANQQLSQALAQYGNQLAGFSPRLDVLKGGLEDAFNPVIAHRNEQAVAEGERMVMESQKTMAQLVADGEITVEESPWLIYGARKASGYLQAAAWQRHVNIKFDDMITKDPAMTELQWDEAHKQMQAEFVSTQRITDPLEMQVFHRGVKASKQNTDAMIVSHAAKHRKHLVTTAMEQRVSTAVEEANSDTFRANPQTGPEVVEVNGVVVSPETGESHLSQATTHVENVQGSLEETIREFAEVYGMGGPTGALAAVGAQVFAALSDPETYSPLLEQAVMGMKNPDGTPLVSGGVWGMYERSSRGARLTASKALTIENKQAILDWYVQNPNAGIDELEPWLAANITTDETTIAMIKGDYWTNRSKINNWGNPSPDELHRVHSHFASGSNIVSYADWIDPKNSDLLDELAGGNAVFRQVLETKDFFDGYENLYWTRGVTTDQVLWLEGQVTKRFQEAIRAGENRFTDDQISELVGNVYPVDSPAHKKEVLRIRGFLNDPKVIGYDGVGKGELGELYKMMDVMWEEGTPFGSLLDMDGNAFTNAPGQVLDPESGKIPPNTIVTRDIVGALVEFRAPDLSATTHNSLVENLFKYQSRHRQSGTDLRKFTQDVIDSRMKSTFDEVIGYGGSYADFERQVRNDYPHNTRMGSELFNRTIDASGKIVLEGLNGNHTIDPETFWAEGNRTIAENKFEVWDNSGLLQQIAQADSDGLAKIAIAHPELASVVQNMENANDPGARMSAAMVGFQRARASKALGIYIETGQVPPQLATRFTQFGSDIDVYQSANRSERKNLESYATLSDVMNSGASTEEEKVEAKKQRDKLISGAGPRFERMASVLDNFGEMTTMYRASLAGRRPDAFLTGEAADVMEAALIVQGEKNLYPYLHGQGATGSPKYSAAAYAINLVAEGGTGTPQFPLQFAEDASGASSDEIFIDVGVGQSRIANRISHLSGYLQDASSPYVVAEWAKENLPLIATRVVGNSGVPIWVENRHANAVVKLGPNRSNTVSAASAASKISQLTYSELMLSVSSNLGASFSLNPMKDLVLDRTGMDPKEIRNTRYSVRPAPNSSYHGQAPRTFDIIQVNKNGVGSSLVVSGVTAEELLEAHIIQETPQFRDQIERSRGTYEPLLYGLNTGDLSVEKVMKTIGPKNKASSDDFIVYFESLSPVKQSQWEPFLMDNPFLVDALNLGENE